MGGPGRGRGSGREPGCQVPRLWSMELRLLTSGGTDDRESKRDQGDEGTSRSGGIEPPLSRGGDDGGGDRVRWRWGWRRDHSRGGRLLHGQKDDAGGVGSRQGRGAAGGAWRSEITFLELSSLDGQIWKEFAEL